MKEKSLNVNEKGIAESLATKYPNWTYDTWLPDINYGIFLVHLCGEVTRAGMSNKKLNRCDIAMYISLWGRGRRSESIGDYFSLLKEIKK